MISEKNKEWWFFIENSIGIVYIGLVFGSIPFADLKITLGVFLGGGLGLINFDLLYRIGEKVFQNPKAPQTSYFAFSWMKFGVLILIMFLALQSGWFHPVAFAAGISDFVLGILFGSIILILQDRKAAGAETADAEETRSPIPISMPENGSES